MRKQESRFAYDSSARVASYDADMEMMHPNRQRMMDAGLRFLPFERSLPLTALDLGVGTGLFTKRFLEEYPRSRVIAVDIAPSMVELAKSRLGPLSERVSFRVGDFLEIERLLGGQEKGQVVISAYALHHLDSAGKRATLSSCLEFLEAGGWVVNADLIVSQTPVLEERIQQLRVEGIIARAGGGDPRFADAPATRRFLDELEALDGDQPGTLHQDLETMRAAGFQDVGVLWLETREAVCVGRRAG